MGLKRAKEPERGQLNKTQNPRRETTTIEATFKFFVGDKKTRIYKRFQQTNND